MGLVGYTGIHIRMDKGLAIWMWMWEGCKKAGLLTGNNIISLNPDIPQIFEDSFFPSTLCQLITNKLYHKFPKQKTDEWKKWAMEIEYEYEFEYEYEYK